MADEEILHILSAEVVGDHLLRLELDDPTAKTVYCRPLLDGPVFEPPSIDEYTLYGTILRAMTQRLHDLVHFLGWRAVETALREIFPDEARHMHQYKGVYELLASLQPSSSELVLRIDPQENAEERWLEVYGEDGTLRDDGELERFALELSPWSKWLGMGVPEELRRELGDAQVVAYCLYEMTTFGFDEESVRAQREELSQRIRRFDAMTPEEREEHLIPWEEVKARLEERLKE